MTRAEPLQERTPQVAEACQHRQPNLFSRLRRPWTVFIASALAKHLWRHGIAGVPSAVVRVLRQRAGKSMVLAPAMTIAGEAIGLQPGELVEVKSEAEIRSTLDANGRLRGLAFLPGMVPHCGRRYRVYKRLERLYWEESGQQRRMKNTVLLAGSICDGVGIGCDRSCLFFWREAWLRRVPEEPAIPITDLVAFPVRDEDTNRVWGGEQ